MNVLVTGDTHVPDFARRLPDALRPHLEWAELILHTGDATSPDVLADLAAHAPMRAVLGNMDGWDVAAWGAPAELQLEIDGLRIAMVHDAGRREGRERRLAERFPDVTLMIFGHSHQPLYEQFGGVRLLNPGSPTWKRRAPEPTVARMTIEAGRARVDVLPLGSAAGRHS